MSIRDFYLRLNNRFVLFLIALALIYPLWLLVQESESSRPQQSGANRAADSETQRTLILT